MVLPVHVSDAEVDTCKNSWDGRRSARHHGLQRHRAAAVSGPIYRSRSRKSAASFDLQYLWSGRFAVHHRDDNRGIRSEVKMRNCKLKIENYKLQMGAARSGPCWSRTSRRNFQFSIFNFQLAIAFLFSALLLSVLATGAFAQTKSSCIEC